MSLETRKYEGGCREESPEEEDTHIVYEFLGSSSNSTRVDLIPYSTPNTELNRETTRSGYGTDLNSAVKDFNQN